MSIRSYRDFTPRSQALEAARAAKPGFCMTTKPVKKLTGGISRSTGRNNRGIITSGQRGGGHKQKYRFLDFRRGTGKSFNMPAIVQTIEYDPNRNARIALICYENGEKTYILHPVGLTIGSRILASEQAPSTVGNALPLKNLPLGVEIHNIELHPGKGGQVARAAGAVAQIIAKEGNFVSIRLPSGEIRFVSNKCWAVVGQVGNIETGNRTLGKAGRTRWLGKRPHVRGAAKNPVDHPHGGGEGRVGIGHPYPMTPWGKCALGKKTRKKKKYSDTLILRSKQ